jgi:hypothetical protein
MKKLNTVAACCLTAGALLALPAAAVAQTDTTDACEAAGLGSEPREVEIGPVSTTITTCADAGAPRCAAGEYQAILVPGVIRLGTKLCKLEWS